MSRERERREDNKAFCYLKGLSSQFTISPKGIIVCSGGEKNMGMTIGKNVQKILDAKGWTPYRLGKESGVSMTVIYSLREKKQGPNAETLVKLATALNVTIDELVKESE